MQHDEDRAWQAIRAQRLAVADLLESLDDGEWRHPSLCEGWSVEDVAVGDRLEDPRQCGQPAAQRRRHVSRDAHRRPRPQPGHRPAARTDAPGTRGQRGTGRRQGLEQGLALLPPAAAGGAAARRDRRRVGGGRGAADPGRHGRPAARPHRPRRRRARGPRRRRGQRTAEPRAGRYVPRMTKVREVPGPKSCWLPIKTR